MNLIPYVSIWAVLTLFVLALAGYWNLVAYRDDQTLDVMENDPQVIEAQKLAIKKIRTIEFYGQSLTVLTVAYGLVIAFVYFYHIWLESTKISH